MKQAAAQFSVTRVTSGRDEDIASGKTKARRERRRRFQHAIDVAVRSQPDDAAADERDPECALLVERHAIGVAAVGDIDLPLTPPLAVEDDHPLPARVTQVQRAPIGGTGNAVRVHYVGDHDAGSTIERGTPQLARNHFGLRVEHGETQRSGVDLAVRVGAQVVPPGHAVDVQDHAGLVSGTHVNDVSARADDAAIGMDRDATDTATLRHDRCDRTRAVDSIHAAAEHVGEQDRPVGIDRRRLGKPVAVREHIPTHRTASLRRGRAAICRRSVVRARSGRDAGQPE
jgi:hypothetical protein